jgi:hypothetical protein
VLSVFINAQQGNALKNQMKTIPDICFQLVTQPKKKSLSAAAERDLPTIKNKV